MGRAPCCDKDNVKRGPWSPDEDATLKNYLEKHGNGGNWIALPLKAGLNRCGKSCRLRWLNYLRPDIKHGDFTEEEDNIICTLYSSLGSRWSRIASQLPGRTDNDVKNYWNTKLKKKLLSRNIGAKRSNNNNSNDTNTNNTSEPSLAQFSSLPKIGTFYPENSSCLAANSTALPPLMEMGYQGNCDPRELTVDQNQFLHSRFEEAPDFKTSGCNSHSVSSVSLEVAGLSTSSSLALENNHSSRSAYESLIQDDGILLDFGFESPYELLSGFDFQEKCGLVAPCLGNPPFTG